MQRFRGGLVFKAHRLSTGQVEVGESGVEEQPRPQQFRGGLNVASLDLAGSLVTKLPPTLSPESDFSLFSLSPLLSLHQLLYNRAVSLPLPSHAPP